MITVAFFFGGRSVEHEVSVISAHQAMAALDRSRFASLPVYIAKNGGWYTGDALRELSRYRDIDALLRDATAVVPAVDVANGGVLWRPGNAPAPMGGWLRRAARDAVVARFDVAHPMVHGSHGEDGTLQGLFELADIAYTGCGVTAAAVGMDKPMQRRLFREAGLPVLDDLVITRRRWQQNAEAVLREVSQGIGYPAYVKPATLGSSIGVTRVGDDNSFRDAADLACAYDERLVVEAAQDDIVEINCSVLGAGEDVRASVCEQPTKQGLLSYADKYAGGSKGGSKTAAKTAGMAAADRLIPAPVSESLTAAIQAAAIRSFNAIGAAGVARVDFLVRPESEWFVVNEINTLPGSLSFYLWEPSGVPFTELLSTLVDQAIARREDKRGSTYSIDAWLLRDGPATGAKH